MRLTCLLIISFLLLTGPGCKKRQDNIYLNSVESGTGGNVQFTDTFTINARTIREDSLKTDSLNYNLIGAVNDPIFGRYAATIYTEFRLPQFNKTASGGVDSAVLYLRLPSTTGFYGDLSSGLSLKVYELNEQILKAKSYHSND
ncbi:MAG: DUF4270 family protein, partial [Bacteroidia bacterium]|nr:DUF4270 family protein [Bacteroidia bacterium]